VINKSGSMQPETRTFAEGGQLPLLGDFFGTSFFGSSQVNLAVFLALAALVLVWLLIWRTRLGYEIRTFGANPSAAVYAGISPVRITIITMLISGGLAGLMAINEIVGSQHRLLIEYVAGYGFVGIAVALMGRAHPVGIMLSAILFGMLYQGGAELAFEMPAITRDMIVVIQGLVILFAGALEYMFRPALVRLFSFSAKPAAAAGKTA